ncbi:MAG: hypothetical protein ACOYMN_06650 [Roseimicrobium sp.]
MTAIDENPLLEIRRIKEEIAAECGGDMRRMDDSLRRLEARLRSQGRVFADVPPAIRYDAAPPATATLREEPPTT